MRTILILAAALLAAPALAQSNPEGTRLVQAGQQAFQTGNYDLAAELLWDATLADTAVRDSAPLQTMRARAMMRSGNPENAIRLFDRIGGTAEEYADAMYWRGEALLIMTEPGEAADSFRLALQFDPGHALAQQRLSSLPPGIATPVAVQAPLIDSAPVEVIATEAAPLPPAQEAPIAPAPAPAPIQQAPIQQAPVQQTPVQQLPVQTAPPAAATGGPVQLRPAPAQTPPGPPAGPPAGPPVDDADQEAAVAAPDSDLALGRAAFATGDYADAATLLWRATLADTAVRDDPAIQTMRARAVMRSGRPDTALTVFQALARDNTGAARAGALVGQGEAEMMLGRQDAAADSFRLALDAEQDYGPALEQLAMLAPPLAVASDIPAVTARDIVAEVVEIGLLPEPAPIPADPEPEPVQMAELAPPPAPQPPVVEPSVVDAPVVDAPAVDAPVAPAPGPELQPEAPAGPLALDAAPPADPEAAAAFYRRMAAEQAEAGSDVGEAWALSNIYVTQYATDAEIARYTELSEGAVSADPARDAQIAQLAGIVHHDLSIALYRSVEATGVVEGRNLAVLRSNLATALLENGEPEEALETAELAVAANEEYANAWGVRSLAKQELGDLGGALEDAKHAFDRGVTAPPVLALLNAAGFAVGVQAQQQTLVEAPVLRGSED